MNSTGKYSASMNEATLGHEWAFVSLWLRREASLKIQANSLMRLRLKISHGDMQTWPKHEPVPQIPSKRTVCAGTVEKEKSENKKRQKTNSWCVLLGCSYRFCFRQWAKHCLNRYKWFNYGAGIDHILSLLHYKLYRPSNTCTLTGCSEISPAPFPANISSTTSAGHNHD